LYWSQKADSIPESKRAAFCATLPDMTAHIYDELQHLSAAEKRALGEALIVSADSEASAPLVTDAQRCELRSRLAHHRTEPEEIGVTFAQLKAKILGPRS
jgi:putative addiction module component (TIGR02574 family)